MQRYDAIVIGAGVIGSSVAYHLAAFRRQQRAGPGAPADRRGHHHPVLGHPAHPLLGARKRGAGAPVLVGVHGLCGLPGRRGRLGRPGPVRLPDLRAGRAKARSACARPSRASAARASRCATSTSGEARDLLPIARFDDAALIGYEPEAGFADAYLVATGFARAARRAGVRIMEGVSVEQLLTDKGRVRRRAHRAGRLRQ